jgi:hypothetical protein
MTGPVSPHKIMSRRTAAVEMEYRWFPSLDMTEADAINAAWLPVPSEEMSGMAHAGSPTIRFADRGLYRRRVALSDDTVVSAHKGDRQIVFDLGDDAENERDQLHAMLVVSQFEIGRP